MWSCPIRETPSGRRNPAPQPGSPGPRSPWTCSLRGLLGGSLFRPACLDQVADVAEQLGDVEDHAVLDRVFEAAMPLDAVGRLVEAHRARPVEQLEVGQWVMVVHQQVGVLAHLQRAQLVLQAAQGGALRRGRADDFERMEAGLLQELQLANIAEAEDLIDEARIAAGADAAAAVLVLVDERHPEAIVLLPLDLVLGRPAIPVGAVSAALRREV